MLLSYANRQLLLSWENVLGYLCFWERAKKLYLVLLFNTCYSKCCIYFFFSQSIIITKHYKNLSLWGDNCILEITVTFSQRVDTAASLSNWAQYNI